MGIIAVVAGVALALASAVISAAPASASGLASIVCGGVKHGSGWLTYPGGGYTGEGCGAGIDYIRTPTSGYSNYHFGTSNGAAHNFQAWIPSAHSTAQVTFKLYVCGSLWSSPVTIDEAPTSGWWTIFVFYGSSGCDVTITALSPSGYAADLGLDAIRSHS
jgi:hypothetical protein